MYGGAYGVLSWQPETLVKSHTPVASPQDLVKYLLHCCLDLCKASF